MFSEKRQQGACFEAGAVDEQAGTVVSVPVMNRP